MGDPRQMFYISGMQSLNEIWRFTRERLKPAYQDLSDEQLCWRPHDEAHSIAEIVYHIAGAEHYWATRLSQRDSRATEWEDKLDRAVIEGFLKEAPCPFEPHEMTKELLDQALEFTGFEVLPLLENPTEKELEMPIVSPIGDQIDGRQGLIRMAQHAAYHTGQIWVYRMDPRFPKA
jgi:uncharacterized damage-inducible protein DinB